MNENIIGIIVCVSVVVCGMCTYFIGLTQGIKMTLKRIVEDEHDTGTSDSGTEQDR